MLATSSPAVMSEMPSVSRSAPSVPGMRPISDTPVPLRSISIEKVGAVMPSGSSTVI